MASYVKLRKKRSSNEQMDKDWHQPGTSPKLISHNNGLISPQQDRFVTFSRNWLRQLPCSTRMLFGGHRRRGRISVGNFHWSCLRNNSGVGLKKKNYVSGGSSSSLSKSASGLSFEISSNGYTDNSHEDGGDYSGNHRAKPSAKPYLLSTSTRRPESSSASWVNTNSPECFCGVGKPGSARFKSPQGPMGKKGEPGYSPPPEKGRGASRASKVTLVLLETLVPEIGWTLDHRHQCLFMRHFVRIGHQSDHLFQCVGFHSTLHLRAWFIMKRRKRNPYKSPFYTIFVALGVADLASYYLYMFKKGSYWGWIPYFFKPYEVSNLPATCFIMTPFLYEKVWTNGVTHLLIALIYIEAGCGALPIFWQSVVFTVTVVSTNGTSNITKKVYNDVWRLHIYTILAVCVFCYFCMFLRIRKLDVLSKNEKMAMELKMFYSVLVLLVANIFYTCYFLARDTLEQTYKEFGKLSEWSLYILADIYDLHNPIGLLITSSEIRQAAFPFCFLSRNNVQIFNTVTNSSRGGNAAKKENNSYGGFPSAKVASTRNITAISNR
uniref:Uncharacterized protein n=1 Tax=Ditylenchus dipsaci TaxID=166011 RepID=A0A915DK98_9BILA